MLLQAREVRMSKGQTIRYLQKEAIAHAQERESGKERETAEEENIKVDLRMQRAIETEKEEPEVGTEIASGRGISIEEER